MRLVPSFLQPLASLAIVASVYGAPAVLALFLVNPIPEMTVAAPEVREVTWIPEAIAADADPEPTAEEVAEAAPASPSRKSSPAPAELAEDSPVSRAAARVGKTRLEREAHAHRRPPRTRGARCLEPSGDIQAMDASHYTVPRDLVDRYVRDLEAASTLASVAWHRDAAGRIDGFVIRRIRCGGTLHEAGFRNGDVVHTVNGKPVDSVSAALGLLWKLRRRDVLHVRITREGATQRLHYTLV